MAPLENLKAIHNYSLSFLAEAFNRSNIATVDTGRYGIASSAALALTNPAPATPFGGPRTFPR